MILKLGDELSSHVGVFRWLLENKLPWQLRCTLKDIKVRRINSCGDFREPKYLFRDKSVRETGLSMSDNNGVLW